MVFHWAGNSPFINDISQLCVIKGWILERDGTFYNKKEYDETMIPQNPKTLANWLNRTKKEDLIFSKEAYLDSNDFRCLLSKFTDFCTETGIIFYLSIICIFLIIIISIFGKIKENYRWFIFNQAIFDLVISTNQLCDYNAFFSTWPGERYRYYYNWCPPPFDIFNSLTLINLFHTAWSNVANTNYYVALFLLSGSRFVCLFFPNFYDRATKGWRLFCWIFGFDFIFVMVSLFLSIYTLLGLSPKLPGLQLYAAPENLLKIVNGINSAKPYACLIPSLFFIAAVVIKIAKHSKFQYQHNRASFYSTNRIAVVMVFQFLTHLFILSIEMTSGGLINFPELQYLKVYNGPFYWMDENWGFGKYENYKTARGCRILLESIIVLTIMTGYREAIVDFVKVYMFRKKQISSIPLQQQSTTIVETIINGNNIRSKW